MEIIRKLRKENNLTQKELALKLNVSESTISKWESGKVEPGIRELLVMAKLFNISIDNLVAGVSDKSQKKVIESDVESGVTLYSGSGFFSIVKPIKKLKQGMFTITIGTTFYFNSWIFFFGISSLSLFWYVAFSGIMTGVLIIIGIMSFLILGLWSIKYANKKSKIITMPNVDVKILKDKIQLKSKDNQEFFYKWSSVVNLHQGRSLLNKTKTAVSGLGVLLTHGGINAVNEVHEIHHRIELHFDDNQTLVLNDSNTKIHSLLRRLVNK